MKEIIKKYLERQCLTDEYLAGFYKGEEVRSQVMPITRQLREHIENCVLEKYQAAIA